MLVAGATFAKVTATNAPKSTNTTKVNLNVGGKFTNATRIGLKAMLTANVVAKKSERGKFTAAKPRLVKFAPPSSRVASHRSIEEPPHALSETSRIIE